VLLPGLVNAHTHASHALLRGLPVRGPRSSWLRETLAPIERRCLSADFVRDGTRLALAEMLRAGITCFADLSLHPEEAARAAAAAHVRAAIALPVSEAPTPWAESATAHLARAERLWDEYRSDPRIALYFAPLVSHGMSEALLTRVRRVADELDARIALHLEEFAALTEPSGPGPQGAPGVEDSARAPPGSPWLRQLRSLGLLRAGFTAIGATVCDEADLELLSRHGASVVSCPQADLRLGARVPVSISRRASAQRRPWRRRWGWRRGASGTWRSSATAVHRRPCTISMVSSRSLDNSGNTSGTRANGWPR